MTTINCNLNDCIYCEKSICTKDKVSFFNECNDYDNYKNSFDYQDEYWMRIGNINARTHKRGRKIIINGIDFYTSDDMRENELNIYVTDARTGIGCGNVKALKKNFEKYKGDIKKYSDVVDLPIAKYDYHKCKYILPDKSEVT